MKENVLTVFKNIAEEVENLLDLSESIPIPDTQAIRALSNQPFRLQAGRAVLRNISKMFGLKVSRMDKYEAESFSKLTGSVLIIVIANKRPPKYMDWSKMDFATILVFTFCNAYAALVDAAQTDEAIADCKIQIALPDMPIATVNLREWVRQIKLEQFGRYTIPSQEL